MAEATQNEDIPLDQEDLEVIEDIIDGEVIHDVFDWALLGNFVILMMVCALLAYLLEQVYRRCGFSLSNRSDFSRNFVLLSCATMMIVTIVKSSLALSLGLVGALSIVRFRAAIKEPEELCFLFLTIGIGLGFGASVGVGFASPEPYIPIVSFAFLAGVLWIRKVFSKRDAGGDYHLLVTSRDLTVVRHETIRNIVEELSRDMNLKRVDESKQILEMSFQVSFTGPNQMSACHAKLLSLSESVTVSMMDNSGVGN
jgi:hypothetical protein